MFWLKLGMVAIYTEIQDLLGDDIGEQACDSTSESRFFLNKTSKGKMRNLITQNKSKQDDMK